MRCWPSGRSFHISPSSTSLSTSFVLLKEGIELGECQEDKRKKRRSRGWSVGSIPTLSFSLPLFFLFRDQAERNVKTGFIVMLTSHWIAPWFMNASLDARFNFFCVLSVCSESQFSYFGALTLSAMFAWTMPCSGFPGKLRSVHHTCHWFSGVL